jgi:hypothetical protein
MLRDDLMQAAPTDISGLGAQTLSRSLYAQPRGLNLPPAAYGALFISHENLCENRESSRTLIR